MRGQHILLHKAKQRFCARLANGCDCIIYTSEKPTDREWEWMRERVRDVCNILYITSSYNTAYTYTYILPMNELCTHLVALLFRQTANKRRYMCTIHVSYGIISIPIQNSAENCWGMSWAYFFSFHILKCSFRFSLFAWKLQQFLKMIRRHQFSWLCWLYTLNLVSTILNTIEGSSLISLTCKHTNTAHHSVAVC